MGAELREFAFGELCTITRGASPRPINDFLSKTGMPWIKIADATSSDSQFLETTNECIKLEGVKASVRVHPGDLILSNSATPGLPKFVMIDACIHDGWMLLRNFNGLDKKFAYWLLLNERKNLVAQGNGSVFTNLKTDILKFHRVRIPDLASQARIAQVLDSIAAKIDLNRRINQTIEAMAQAIFKSWFVDFDPVKAKIAAKAEGRDPLRAAMTAISGKPDAELDTLPPDQFVPLAATATLFPDEMEDSELGEIPRGWRVKKFGDFIDRISVGKKFDQKTALVEGLVPILDQGKSGIIGFHNELPGVRASLEKPVVVFANHTCYMRLITFNFSAT
ncbi:MAG: restriction endonuclease subunit S [Burkholderiales bacterium]